MINEPKLVVLCKKGLVERKSSYPFNWSITALGLVLDNNLRPKITKVLAKAAEAESNYSIAKENYYMRHIKVPSSQFCKKYNASLRARVSYTRKRLSTFYNMD